jgi:hypothetical protein
MCILIYSTTFVCNISHCKKNRARHDQEMYIDLHAKYRLLLTGFNGT